jgi:hypothetical protein
VTDTEAGEVRRLTDTLRSNVDPLWTRLRELLHERGISPGDAALTDCFPDDSSFLFGVVVMKDGRVFQFGYDYLHTDISRGVFSEWEDWSSRFSSTRYRDSVEAALQLLKEERAG